MAIEFVNGYACRDCGEAAMAKRGIDPQQMKGIESVQETDPKSGNAAPDDAVSAIAEDTRPRASLAYSLLFDKLA